MNEIMTVQNRMQQYTPEEIELLKNTICKDSSDEEFELFLQIAKSKGLNPFDKQIHAVKRWDKKTQKNTMTVQVGIDGLRLVADRTGKYAGQTKPEWCGDDGKWVDVWLKNSPPSAARVGVFKKDCLEPFYGIATLKSYMQTSAEGRPTNLWAKMPDLMLAKCAEALALRKGFPAETSSIYIQEEMDQADSEDQKINNPFKEIRDAKKIDDPVYVFKKGKFKDRKIIEISREELHDYRVDLIKAYNPKAKNAHEIEEIINIIDLTIGKQETSPVDLSDLPNFAPGAES